MWNESIDKIITGLNTIDESVNKELYGDLYAYAENYRYTNKWTDDNVKAYLAKQKKLWGEDVLLDTLDKVNKDFKKKNKVKSDPYNINLVEGFLAKEYLKEVVDNING